jgi:hypothetical protein
MDSKFPQYHVFTEFAHHFTSPDRKNLPDFTFYSSIFRILYRGSGFPSLLAVSKAYCAKGDFCAAVVQTFHV